MKRLLAAATIAVMGFLATWVVAQNQPATPPGISSAEWIPLGENFGFVVTSSAAPHNPDTLTGYFIARRGSEWKKVDSEGGFRFQPLQK